MIITNNDKDFDLYIPDGLDLEGVEIIGYPTRVEGVSLIIPWKITGDPEKLLVHSFESIGIVHNIFTLEMFPGSYYIDFEAVPF